MENSSEVPNSVKLAVQAIVKNLSFFIKGTFPKRNKNRYDKNRNNSTVSHINCLIPPPIRFSVVRIKTGIKFLMQLW